MIAFAFFLLFSPAVLSGDIFVSWSNADLREDGTPFIDGEFVGTRVLYSRKNQTHQLDTDAEGIKISGLQKGWWDVKLQSISKCHLVQDPIEASLDFLSDDHCYSGFTPTLRVKVR